MNAIRSALVRIALLALCATLLPALGAAMAQGMRPLAMAAATLPGTMPARLRLFAKRAEQSFGADAPAALALYPHATVAEAKASAEYLLGDLVVTWPTLKWANLLAESGKTATYVYLFAKTPPPEYPFHVPAHGAEIVYAFNNLQAFPWSWDAMDRQIAQTMSGDYANFALTGNPNGPGLPNWPLYRPDAPQHMVFDASGIAAAPLPMEKFKLISANMSAGPWCPEVK